MHNSIRLSFILYIILFTLTLGQSKKSNIWDDENFDGLEFRSIGPALMSGRISDIAIHPEDENTWYLAVGSGGVWKTVNGYLFLTMRVLTLLVV
jgi:hypothetical protein